MYTSRGQQKLIIRIIMIFFRHRRPAKWIYRMYRGQSEFISANLVFFPSLFERNPVRRLPRVRFRQKPCSVSYHARMMIFTIYKLPHYLCIWPQWKLGGDARHFWKRLWHLPGKSEASNCACNIYRREI